MCKFSVTSNTDIMNLYQAAKAAKDQGKDPVVAARAAAEKEGVCSEDSENFLNSLENDPELLNKMTEDKNEVVVYGPPEAKASYDFVDNNVQSGQNQPVKSISPVPKNYMDFNDPKLAQRLKDFARELDSNAGGRQQLIDNARIKGLNEAKIDHEKESFPLYAENRTKDFLGVLDKVKEGKKLDRKDIQDIQKFIFFDTAHGKSLSKKGDQDSGIDGLYGPLTNHALKTVLDEVNKK